MLFIPYREAQISLLKTTNIPASLLARLFQAAEAIESGQKQHALPLLRSILDSPPLSSSSLVETTVRSLAAGLKARLTEDFPASYPSPFRESA